MNATRIIARHSSRRALSIGSKSSSRCGEIATTAFRAMTTMNHNSACYTRRDSGETAPLVRERSLNRIGGIRPLGFSPFSNIRSFSTTSTSGGGDDEGDDARPPIVAPEILSDATIAYDPYEITKSFEDTSYYYPPSEEMDPKFLAAKYQGMTNEELLDASTISGEKPATGEQVTWESIMHSPPIRDKNASLPKGSLVGKVVSTKMQKTVNVAVDRYRIHPKYRKRIRYTRKFMAHDEEEVASNGDTVLIVPSQRVSKKKHFVLREIIRAKGQL